MYYNHLSYILKALPCL